MQDLHSDAPITNQAHRTPNKFEMLWPAFVGPRPTASRCRCLHSLRLGNANIRPLLTVERHH
jgi:hypothetical protein